MSGGAEKVVCVTGASGYIASWLVKLLLQRGYTVKATVRDPNDPRKVEHLLAFDGAKERLHLFKADLLEDGSFDSVVDGCKGIFHTASPVINYSADPQTELIEPALKGTLNVLRSCAKGPSIKRVVITSSMAAVAFNGKPLAHDVLIDETWFSDAALCEKSKLWYSLSKTLAEAAAWKFAKENSIDMVTINPGFVIGPLLQPTLNTSVEPILKLINDSCNGPSTIAACDFALDCLQQIKGVDGLSYAGAKTFSNATYRWADVRDVANAHILAFESPSASGRYCLVGRVMHCYEVVKILHELFPDLNLPEKSVDDNPFVPTYQVSKERAENLGLNFTAVEVSLKDTVESLKEKKLLSV